MLSPGFRLTLLHFSRAQFVVRAVGALRSEQHQGTCPAEPQAFMTPEHLFSGPLGLNLSHTATAKPGAATQGPPWTLHSSAGADLELLLFANYLILGKC